MGWREKLAQLTGRRPAVLPCKKGKGDLCVVVTRSDNPAAGVPGCVVVVTGPSPGNANTDATGVAEFSSRTPGNYAYTVKLPPGSDKKWKLQGTGGATTVGAGGVANEFVEACPIGTLVVRVFDDLSPRNRVRAATSSSVAYVNGGEPTEHTSSDLYLTVPAGAVSVNVSPFHANLYEATAGQQSVNVPQGGTGIAEFVLPVINRVTPKLEPQADELWFLRPDPPAPPPPPPPEVAPPPWPPLPEEQPTVLRLGLHETRPEKTYSGTGTLTYDAATLAVFRDSGCTQVLASGATLSNGELKAGLQLHVKGLERGPGSLQLALAPSGNPTIAVDGPAHKVLTVREVNVVEPQIKLEYKVVLWDRGLSAHQKDDKGVVEKELFKSDATRIELQVQQRGADAPYTLSGKLEAPNCDVFTDEACTKMLSPNAPISVSVMSKSAYPLWLRGTAKGQFDLKLTMTAASGGHIHVRGPAVQRMGVVELEMKLHQYDESALEALEVDPANDPIATYHTNLENKAIPDQAALTDAKKVWPGRLLHVQKNGAQARAKLVLKARDASQWPPGTDDYTVHINRTNNSGSVVVCDAETEGTTLTFPVPREGIKASALNADKTYWVEGAGACDAWRDVRLDLTLDREPGGLAHEPKRNADWARFTVVEIEKVEFSATTPVDTPVVWNDAKARYFINTQAGEAGRTLNKVANQRDVKVLASLSKPIKGVKLHFMLIPDPANATPIGLDAGWKPHELKVEIRAKDREDRKKLLHFHQETDAQGKAAMEKLVLSGFGGDKFTPAAYITQDPHLAKYVENHASLGKRKPVKYSKPLQVWKRFDYQLAYMNRHDGSSYGNRLAAASVEAKFEADYIQLDAVGVPVVKAHKYLTENADARDWVEAALGPEAPRTLQFALVEAIATGAPADHTLQATNGVPGMDFGWPVNGKCFDLSAKANWFKSATVSVHGTAIGPINIPQANVTLVDDGVNHRLDVSLAGIPALAGQSLADIRVHVVITERSFYSGLSWGAPTLVGMRWRESGFPGQESDATLNTTYHEAGHYLGLAPKTLPDTAATASTLWYDSPGVGNHCKHGPEDCVMWHAFLLKFDFCPTCKLALRARDHVSNVDAAAPF